MLDCIKKCLEDVIREMHKDNTYIFNNSTSLLCRSQVGCLEIFPEDLAGS